MENKNGSLEKYKNEMQEIRHMVMDDAENLGCKAIEGMEQLGHKAIAESEMISNMAIDGVNAIKKGAQKAIDKTIQGMENLQQKMK